MGKICELWVQGTAENGGQVYVDVLVSAGIDENAPFPSLTVIDTGSYTRYSANPGWPYDAAGWYSAPSFYYKNCGGATPPDPNAKHDCLNGNCIPAETYGTPGAYGNLAGCTSGCAKNSPCDGECVPFADIAALQQAASQIRSRLCG